MQDLYEDNCKTLLKDINEAWINEKTHSVQEMVRLNIIKVSLFNKFIDKCNPYLYQNSNMILQELDKLILKLTLNLNIWKKIFRKNNERVWAIRNNKQNKIALYLIKECDSNTGREEAMQRIKKPWDHECHHCCHRRRHHHSEHLLGTY